MRERKPVPTPSPFQQLLRWIFPWYYPDVYSLRPGDSFRLVGNHERFIVTENSDYLHCVVTNDVATFGETRKFATVRIRWQVRR